MAKASAKELTACWYVKRTNPSQASPSWHSGRSEKFRIVTSGGAGSSLLVRLPLRSARARLPGSVHELRENILQFKFPGPGRDTTPDRKFRDRSPKISPRGRPRVARLAPRRRGLIDALFQCVLKPRLPIAMLTVLVHLEPLQQVVRLSLEGVSQMDSIPPGRLLTLVRPGNDLVLRRIRNLKCCVQACGCNITTPRYSQPICLVAAFLQGDYWWQRTGAFLPTTRIKLGSS